MRVLAVLGSVVVLSGVVCPAVGAVPVASAALPARTTPQLGQLSAQPEAPTSVTARAGNTSAVVSWTAPYDGGSAITSYEVTAWKAGAVFASWVKDQTCAAAPCTITGLTNGSAYRFTVVASNAVGDSPESANSAFVTPASVPSAAAYVTVEGYFGEPGVAGVAWYPGDNGGSTVIDYTVTATPGGKRCVVAGAQSPYCRMKGLVVGATYSFTVAARNATGTGPAAVSKPFQVLANALDPFAQKAGYGDVLKVEVSQDGGGTGSGIGVFSFQVQKRNANGSWATLPTTFRTSGDGIGMVTLAPGRYRAVIDAKAGFTGAVTNEVTLTEPTVRVQARPGGYGNKLVVDVDPNKGSGYWKFKVQKRTASGAWRNVGKSRRTSGSGEVKTITLPKGTYRVTVAGKYGYVGTASQPVVLPGRTVKVSSGSRGSQLIVRIEPNVGRFTFQLVRNGTTLGTVYRTNSSGTALTPPLPPGRYSVAVDGAHGYRGGVSGPITLR